jgi:hypothetical protein
MSAVDASNVASDTRLEPLAFEAHGDQERPTPK